MIIVSQDRLSVTNFDNIATFDANIPECTNQIVATFPTGKGIPMGKFKDDDRLKEVIDEFRQAYRDGQKVFYVPTN